MAVFGLRRDPSTQVVELSDVCSMATDVSAGACCASLADLGVGDGGGDGGGGGVRC